MCDFMCLASVLKNDTDRILGGRDTQYRIDMNIDVLSDRRVVVLDNYKRY